MMLRYTVNSLIEWKDGTESTSIERLLWMDDEIAYVIDLNKNKVPYIRRIEDIEVALAEDKAEIIKEDKYIVVLREEDIAEKHKVIRDKAWNIVKDMVDKEPDIYQASFRRKLIKKASENYGISEFWILEYLKRYWKREKPVMPYCQTTETVVQRVKRERLEMRKEEDLEQIKVLKEKELMLRKILKEFFVLQ